MRRHQFTDDNIARGWPVDYMCGCPKGDLLGPCEHAHGGSSGFPTRSEAAERIDEHRRQVEWSSPLAVWPRD